MNNNTHDDTMQEETAVEEFQVAPEPAPLPAHDNVPEEAESTASLDVEPVAVIESGPTVIADQDGSMVIQGERDVSFLSREPVAIQAVVQATIALAMGFGMGITTEQMGLILMLSAAILGLITRQQVTPFVPTGTTPKAKNLNNTPAIKPVTTTTESNK